MWLSSFCNIFKNLIVFLDASSHLYMRSCPSVRRSVRRSVGPSVTCFFFNIKLKHFPHENHNRLSRYVIDRSGWLSICASCASYMCFIHVLHVLNMPMDASLACWALLCSLERVDNTFVQFFWSWWLSTYLASRLVWTEDIPRASAHMTIAKFGSLG